MGAPRKKYGVRGGVAGTPQENVEKLWQDLLEYYRIYRPAAQLETLKLSSFSNARAWRSKAPQLKSKANKIRHSGGALLFVWRKYMNNLDLQHKQIEMMLQRSERMEIIITEQKARVHFLRAGK